MDSAILATHLSSSPFPCRLLPHCRALRCVHSGKNGVLGRQNKVKGILGEKMVMMGLSATMCYGYWNHDKIHTNNKINRREESNPLVKAEMKAASSGEGEADEALRATIEKSKKVLAMQNDLLKQIAERRDLISSMKKNISCAEPVLSDSPGLNASFANVDGNAADENAHSRLHAENFDSDSFSDKANHPTSPSNTAVSNDHFTQEKISDALHEPPHMQAFLSDFGSVISSAGDDFVPDHGKRLDSFSVEADVPEELRVSSSSLEPSVLPPFTEGTDDYQPKKAHEADVFSNLLYEVIKEPEISSKDKDLPAPPLAGQNVMNVILVAAECAPWSKTGGLGDVAGALPKALARRGHRVMVVAPKYGDYHETEYTGVNKRYNVAGQDIEVGYHQCYIDGVDFVFINNSLFHHNAKNIYGGDRLDILKRMVLFCKAAVEVAWHVPCGGVCYGDGNLVFIANDWHTALLPVYLKAYYRDHGLMKYARSVLVIHNIAHQGRGPVTDFAMTGLPEDYLDVFRHYDPVGGEHFNIFAAGIKTADRVVTVSHGYAWELKTSEGGWGLHGIINENDWKLRGIVNGIDMSDWNPQSDVHLQSDGYTNYSLETLEAGKTQCKAALQRELGLPVRADVPLIGFIGRLDYQKGVDLIAEAIPWMVEQDLQLVMLGTGRHDLENMLRQFEGRYRDKVRGWVGFSVKMAHRITAGSDILLMPSRFEPCGLNQLYAMVYGTVPVVHAVGGLRDTVQPFDPFNNTGLGWTFERAEASQLIHALGNCLWTYRDYKDSWTGIQRRGMMQDLSWDHAAEIYEEVLVAAKYQW